MKKLLFILGFTCSSFIRLGQTGEVYQEIDGFNLNNEAVTIPKDVKDKYSLIGVAFLEDNQQDLYTWSQLVYSKFINDNNLSSLVYNPHVQLILMYTGANQITYNKAKQQITEGTDENLAENIVFYKGAMENYRKTLKMKDRKKPYFFVLDKIYATSRRYTMKALREFGNLIEE